MTIKSMRNERRRRRTRKDVQKAIELVGGHVLLVGGPCDALVLEELEVDDGGDVGGDVVHVVVGHAEEIAADGGDVCVRPEVSTRT
jgi:hypothetical protein